MFNRISLSFIMIMDQYTKIKELLRSFEIYVELVDLEKNYLLTQEEVFGYIDFFIDSMLDEITVIYEN